VGPVRVDRLGPRRASKIVAEQPDGQYAGGGVILAFSTSQFRERWSSLKRWLQRCSVEVSRGDVAGVAGPSPGVAGRRLRYISTNMHPDGGTRRTQPGTPPPNLAHHRPPDPRTKS
jgi:hypothetical protein